MNAQIALNLLGSVAVIVAGIVAMYFASREANNEERPYLHDAYAVATVGGLCLVVLGVIFIATHVPLLLLAWVLGL